LRVLVLLDLVGVLIFLASPILLQGGYEETTIVVNANVLGLEAAIFKRP